MRYSEKIRSDVHFTKVNVKCVFIFSTYQSSMAQMCQMSINSIKVFFSRLTIHWF